MQYYVSIQRDGKGCSLYLYCRKGMVPFSQNKVQRESKTIEIPKMSYKKLYFVQGTMPLPQKGRE